MNLRCLFDHKWNGCKCSRCGKIRDEQHKWNGCDCIICGKFRHLTHYTQVGGIDDIVALEKIIKSNAYAGDTIMCTKIRCAVEDKIVSQRAHDILNIRDSDKLIAVIKNENNYKIRRIVTKKLTNQTVLAYITENDKDGGVRVHAAERLIDKSLAQHIFANIVKDDTISGTWRKNAFENITDQTALQAISDEPYVKILIKEKEQKEELIKIEKENEKRRITNCKHKWEHTPSSYQLFENTGYQELYCPLCGDSKLI